MVTTKQSSITSYIFLVCDKSITNMQEKVHYLINWLFQIGIPNLIVLDKMPTGVRDLIDSYKYIRKAQQRGRVIWQIHFQSQWKSAYVLSFILSWMILWYLFSALSPLTNVTVFEYDPWDKWDRFVFQVSVIFSTFLL